MLKLWSVRVYFHGDGEIVKADGVIELRAMNAEDARDAARRIAEDSPIFSDLTFVRATARCLSKPPAEVSA